MRWLRSGRDWRWRVLACLASVALGASAARYLGERYPATALAHALSATPTEAEPVAPPPAAASAPEVPSPSAAAPAPAEPTHDPLGSRYARGKVITGRTPHKLLLFTFDDGPDLRTTPRILDILDEHDIGAVFFLSSGRIATQSVRGRERAALAREIAARGHLLGDHTVDHALLTRLTNPSIVAQLEASQELFTEVLGGRPWLFRPPGGSRSERVDALVAAQGYTQLLWNIGGADHENHTPEEVLATWRGSLNSREESSASGGGVILLHDTHQWTVEALPRILEDIRRRNCALLARGEELYDIVDDPAFFFAARGDAPPGSEAPPARPDRQVLAARQEKLRTELAEACGIAPRAAEPAHVIEDPSGRALDHFYDVLAQVDAARRGEAGDAEAVLARVLHMGDSGLNRDQLPHFLRSRFQERFGDGGAGFVLIQPGSAEYRNNMVEHWVQTPWQPCSLLERCDDAGHYGLGGVIAHAGRASHTRIRTRSSGRFGREASRLELSYAVQPGGEPVDLRIDGESRRIETDAAAMDDRWLAVDLEAGPHEITVQATGRARVYGVTLETDGPGVVWDTVSMTGAFTHRLLAYDEEHFARQLAHRRPDLVVLHYGGNDLRRYLEGGVTLTQFEDETRQVLERVRAARPEASCLLTGIADHGRSGPMLVRSQHVEPLVEAQRSAAQAAGCAFFDTYDAMGGRGSIHRWHRRGLASADLVHLTPEGRRRVADWLYDALLAGFEGR